MIKTVIPDKNENSKKVYTAYNKDYIPVWTSTEYRFDTELVKHDKEIIVFKTRLGYEAYKLVPSANGFVAEYFDYKKVMTEDEIEKFDKYYEKMYGKQEHPEIDLTPEEAYKLLELNNRAEEIQDFLDKKILKDAEKHQEYKNAINQMLKEVKELKAERDEQAKKLQELQNTATLVMAEATKNRERLIKQLKSAELKIKQYEDFYEHWAKWYAKNKVAIQTLKHEKMIKTAIILMIINIFMVIAIF